MIMPARRRAEDHANKERAPQAANSGGSTKAKKTNARVQYANPAFGSTVPHDPDAKIVNFPCTRDALLRENPDANALSLYDGSTCLGFVVALDHPGKGPCWAFTAADRLLGAYCTRRLAMQAVGEAFDRQR